MSTLVNQLPFHDQSMLLISQDVNETCFDGYILLKDEEFRLKIKLVSPLSLKDARFYSEWKLKNLIRGYEDILLKRLQQSSTLSSFLEELKALIENLLSFKRNKLYTSKTSRYSAVIKEMEIIGWDKLMYANEDFDVIKLTTRDSKDRNHVITVKINVNASLDLSCVTDLPCAFNPRCLQQDGALKLLFEQFLQTIEVYQHFWDMVDEIDNCCWTLEPENVTYGCTYRRIALGKNSSILVRINPLHPFEFPECRLLGADHVIEPLKQKLNSNINSWSNKKSILENLKFLLEVEFPSPATVSKEEVRMECGICYAYRLFDEIPDRTCNDPRCGQTYHSSCLIEWLRSLPSCRQSFNVIFGECPYCNKNLTVRLGKPIKT